MTATFYSSEIATATFVPNQIGDKRTPSVGLTGNLLETYFDIPV